MLPTTLAALAVVIAATAGGGFATAQTAIVGPAVPPAGSVIPYAGETEPRGYVFADGRELSRTEYAELFAAIGTRYGAPTETTFRVPDLRRRFPLGRNDTGQSQSTLGETGGQFDHTHDVNAHSHTQAAHTHGLESHTHSTPDHRHTVSAHSHGIGSDGSHNHMHMSPIVMNSNNMYVVKPSDPQLDWAGASYDRYDVGLGSLVAQFVGGGSSIAFERFGVTSSTNGNHNHGGSTASSAASSTPTGEGGGTTGGSGALTTASGGDGSTSSETATTAGSNPPYVVLNYLIHTGRRL